MPVQIIDNFDLTSAKPMDNRIVVGPNNFYTNKDDIQNKYEGLRIWELPGAFLTGGGTNTTANGVAYVWNGTTWIGENTTSITGGGSVGQVAYFNTTNSIQASNIYFSSQRIGIGTAPETGANGAVLLVNGSIKSTGGTIIGSAWNSTLSVGLTNINASNLDLGTVPIGRLPGSTATWILTADGASSASYKSPSSINVGSATTLQTTRTIWGQNFNGSANVSGDMTVSGDIYRAKSIRLLSGGVDSSSSKIATVQFASSATSNKTLNIPTTVANSDTFAFLATSQTFTVAQTMGSTLTVNGQTTLNNELAINISSSQKLRVYSTGVVFGREIATVFSPLIRIGTNTSPTSPSFTFYNNDQLGIYRPSSDVMGFVSGGVEKMRLSNSGLRIGNGGVNVLTHLSGYIKFTRNSDGTGFSYGGNQKGGVTGVTDISGSGTSFVSTTGLIRIRITFAAGTFQGTTDENIVLASFGLDDTAGNILYYCQQISGKVISDSQIEVRMDFAPVPAAGYNIRLNFIVQSIV